MSAFRSEITIFVQSARVEVPSQAFYYLEYKLKDTKIARKSSEKFSNNKTLIQFADRKAFAIDQCNSSGSYEGELIVSLFVKKLVREQMQDRAQLIGQISLLVSQIIDEKYVEERQYPFTFSSSNTFLTFCCLLNIEGEKAKNSCYSSPVIENYKDEELISQVSHSPPSLHYQNPSPPSQIRSQSTPAKEEFLIHQGSFFSQQSLLKAIDSPSFLQKRIQQMENMDMQFLIKDIYRLQRLLYIGRNERKIEIDRHDQQIKDFARQLSLKQAQLIKIREEMEHVSEKTGEILDQCEYLSKQKQNFESSLKNQQILNRKLQENYQQLSHRIQELCMEGKDSSLMKQQFTQQTQKRTQLQKQLAIQVQKQMQLKQQLQNTKRQLLALENRHEQLLFQLQSKQQMVNLCKEYEQRLGQLEEKIDMIEEEGQYLHRQTYDSYSGPKSIIDKIRIEDQIQESSNLRRIIEEQLQESLASIEDKNKNYQESNKIIPQIGTATTITDCNIKNEPQFLQILTKNLQKDYDKLQFLYRDLEEKLNYKHFQLQQSEKSLAQLRYQFLLELSKVTALINQHMIENRSLRQENLELKQSLNSERYKHQLAASSVQQFPNLQKFPSQPPFNFANKRDESFYYDRCIKLEQQNQLLIRYNRQKEELYEMIMGNRYEQGDKIVERFEDSLKYILQNKSKFSSLLQKYGLLQCTVYDGIKKAITSQESISDIINNFTKNQQETFKKRIQQSSIVYQSCEVIYSGHNEDLLLESTAKQRSLIIQTPKINNIESAITQISTLFKQRQKIIGSFSFKQRNDIDGNQKQALRNNISKRLQSLKIFILREIKNTSIKDIISSLKEIQHLIEDYCLL